MTDFGLDVRRSNVTHDTSTMKVTTHRRRNVCIVKFDVTSHPQLGFWVLPLLFLGASGQGTPILLNKCSSSLAVSCRTIYFNHAFAGLTVRLLAGDATMGLQRWAQPKRN